MNFKNPLFFVFLLLSFASLVRAQSDVSLKLRESGLQKVIQAALKKQFKQNGPNRYEKVIPSRHVKGEVQINTKDNLLSKIREYIQMNLKSVEQYSLSWEDIYVSFDIDTQKTKIRFANHGKNLEMGIVLIVDKLSLKSQKIVFCRSHHICDFSKNLGAQINDLNLSLQDKSNIELELKLLINLEDKDPQFKLLSLNSSFDSQATNKTVIHFNWMNMKMTQPIFTIDNEKYEVDTSKVESILKDERSYIARLIVNKFGEYLSGALVDKINQHLVSEINKIDYDFDLYKYAQEYTIKSEFSRDINLIRQDPVITPTRRSSTFINKVPELRIEKSFSAKMQEFFEENIGDFLVSASLDTLHTDHDSEVTINSTLSVRMNGQDSYSDEVAKKYDQQSKYINKVAVDSDFSIVLNEKFINNNLSYFASKNLLTEAFNKLVTLKGVQLHELRFYAAKEHSIDLVALVSIDLRKLVVTTSEDQNSAWRFMQKIKGALKNQVGHLIEGGSIWFPIQVNIRPKVSTDAKKIKLLLSSPVQEKKLLNDYEFPMKQMSTVVEEALVQTLEEEFAKVTKQDIEIRLDEQLQHDNFELNLKNIRTDENGYILLDVNINRLNI